ncbi:extracelullar DNA degradation protein EddB [Nitzschia inconspicua]|uniref:Extracelullar DNA degradation protein EddB n=1 Tax=Nitzschia inconspicua TaxID=303405 RepID=A0A9K3L5V0_9STRA|nr:extracelullar DNA degradation protein EddB [Nitzschia inconspicua]
MKVSDLTQYQVEVYFNGATTAGATIPLTGGALEPCESWIISDNDESLVDFEADQEVTNNLWNGNDAIILRRIADSTIMDSLGKVGDNPGASWSNNGVQTVDRSLCRKTTVMTGDIDPSDDFDPSLERNQFNIDVFFTQMDNGCKCFDGSSLGPTEPPPPTFMPTMSPTVPPRDVFIHEIQGSGFTSPIVGVRVRVQAIVIGDFQNGDADEER